MVGNELPCHNPSTHAKKKTSGFDWKWQLNTPKCRFQFKENYVYNSNYMKFGSIPNNNQPMLASMNYDYNVSLNFTEFLQTYIYIYMELSKVTGVPSVIIQSSWMTMTSYWNWLMATWIFWKKNNPAGISPWFSQWDFCRLNRLK